MSDVVRRHLRAAGRCRVWEGGVFGHPAVVLENRHLRATVLPQRGGLLHELVHKPSDTDLLWRWSRGLAPSGVRAASIALPQGGYQDSFVGGWDLTFPAVARLQADAGTVVGSHGETWALPWRVEVVHDASDRVEVVLTTSCLRTPFDLRRRLVLTEDAALRCVTDVVNRGLRAHPWALGEHAVWDVAPALAAGGRVRLAGEVSTAPEQPDGSRLAPGRTGAWPLVATTNGEVRDLSAPGPGDRGSTGLASVRVTRGEVVLEIPGRPLVTLGWDHDVLPHLLLWLPFGGDHGAPWFGTVEALGLEPVSARPWDRTEDLPRLGAGERLRSAWRVSVDDNRRSA